MTKLTKTPAVSTPDSPPFYVPESNSLSGIGSVLSIAGNYYRFDLPTPRPLSDELSLASDWATIGKDLQGTMD